MSDLPSITNEKLEVIKAEIERMRRGSRESHLRPHKLVMLMAIIELADRGLLIENKIYPRDPLLGIFEGIFKDVQQGDDLCQPGPPFFHLRTSGFWFHKVRVGKEDIYAGLKTTGGSIHKVQDLIEYAYLREDFFSALIHNWSRQELRGFIMNLLNPPKIKRLETAFSETFSLSREQLNQVLDSASNYDGRKPFHELLRINTTLGTNQVKAMPHYGLGSGLLDTNYQLTSFGKFVQQNDPLMQQLSTQWLMHYFLSAPQGPGPAYWHELVVTRIKPGEEFSKNELIEQVNNFLIINQNKQLNFERTIRSAVNAFLGTYSKRDGLQDLGIIATKGEDIYRVLDTEAPSTWVVAYALLDFWKARFPNQTTINLNDLYGENGLTSLFLISKGRLNAMLEEMQREGMLELYRIAPPYQVVLLATDEVPILERLYGVGNPG